jgi:hypothetical protein
MDAHDRSNGGRAMIMTMVGCCVRVTFMLPHAVVTLSHLGHPQVELILFFWHLFSHFKHYEH